MVGGEVGYREGIAIAIIGVHSAGAVPVVLLNKVAVGVVGVLNDQVPSAVAKHFKAADGIVTVVNCETGLIHATGPLADDIVGEIQPCAVRVVDLGQQV